MAVMANTLTPDSQAVALLCTTLALPRGELKPLNPSEWSTLATAIRHSGLQRPSELFGHSAREIEEALSLPPGSGSRVESLLQRGGQLAFELERLSSRGMWLMTRADSDYPAHYKSRLKQAAPPVLFGAGARENLSRRSAAVVGSRDADTDSLEFATMLSRALAVQNFAVASGAARGVDSTAMLAALDAGGLAIGVVADALDKAVRRRDLRPHITENQLTLVSPYHPQARFNVGNAMRRNRLIYTLAEAAFVVASGVSGGTFSGATEALKAKWVPLFVAVNGKAAGNLALIEAGAVPLERGGLEEVDLFQRIADVGPVGQLAVDWQATERSGALEPALDGADEEELAKAADAALASSGDLFPIVWPSLAAFLRVARTERETAAQFVIEQGQARTWLKRAVHEGLAETVGRPLRYQLVESERLSLLDEDESKSDGAY
jgi:predicted Rossmann fold nucleotide-binding protein DprA/Smf involved in DNA uptake